MRSVLPKNICLVQVQALHACSWRVLACQCVTRPAVAQTGQRPRLP